MNIIFQINGGIGKVIASTAICVSIKEKYPDCKLIVVSGYPEVFLGNKNVDRAFAFGQQAYFYQEHIENQEVLILAQEPYLETNHIKSKEHLVETWCNMYDLPFIQKHGELFLTQREKDFLGKGYISEKPIFLIHANGGANEEQKYSWARDIPANVVNKVIAEYSNDYHIVQMRREHQIAYEGASSVLDSFRHLLVLMLLSEKRLLMDSFSQHAAAALHLPSTVLWIAHSPIVFGYELHNNIQALPHTIKPELRNSYFSKFNMIGDPVEFPYNNELEIFDVDQIIKSFK
jgi:hypothetical protein